jgi:hypothetical protein
LAISSLFLEPADEADLSNISEDEESQESIGHLSNIKSSVEGSPSIPGPTVELEADEIPIYSTKDILKFLQYSAKLLESKKERMAPLVQIKQERSAVPVAVKTEKLESNPKPTQLDPAVEGKIVLIQVPKKDYCQLSAENVKILKEIQTSTTNPGKNTNERLDKVCMVMTETGLISMVKL